MNEWLIVVLQGYFVLTFILSGVLAINFGPSIFYIFCSIFLILLVVSFFKKLFKQFISNKKWS